MKQFILTITNKKITNCLDDGDYKINFNCEAILPINLLFNFCDCKYISYFYKINNLSLWLS